MREVRVEGGTPKARAAPLSPAIFQFADSRACSRLAFSTSFSSERVRTTVVELPSRQDDERSRCRTIDVLLEGSSTTVVRTRSELKEVEKASLLQALESANWKIAGESGAARALGVPPSTLTSRMKALGIRRSR